MTVWRVRIDDAVRGVEEVVVDGAPDSTCGDLARALSDAGFRGAEASIRRWELGQGGKIADLDLAHGDTISCGTRPPEPPAREPGTYLIVIAGMDAGCYVRVDQADMLVGRAPEASLRLQDGLVGRRHLLVSPALDHEPGVQVTDLGSGNGTLVEGRVVASPTAVVPGELIQCGATLLAVEVVGDGDLPALADVEGATRSFSRRFREALPPLTDRLRAPAALDDEDPPPRPGWWRPLIPLVSGIALVLITGRWQFLIVMALGPILLLIEAQRAKKAQDARSERKRLKAAAELRAHEERVSAALAAEQRRRRQLSPGAGSSVVHGQLRTRQLWARSPDDDDFGAVTVGFAALPTALKVESSAGDTNTPELWRVPVFVSMPKTGALAVLGAPNRSRAVARGLVLSLAIHHSPGDLRVWVLTDTQGVPGWAFARWLPHAFIEGGGVRLATNPEERSELLKVLGQIVETRADEASKSTSATTMFLPLDVVVLDFPGSASRDEVATLLSRGARHGILGIAVEAEKVLEGVQGTIRLSEHSDEATFESRFHPKVQGVTVAEVGIEAAQRAALAISGLRPAGAEAATDSADLRLTDLMKLTDLSGEAVARRWSQSSPRTAALVGKASGSPMVVDIVNNGPHGLVGGTTRSGKTEFLKTLFAALILDNSPDDLAIIIVDFKGGVDHAPFAGAPHVISLSTNADVDRFTRTITLLVAEQNRRQQLFREHGAANLDAYRGVRKADPSLPAVPRLLVVVDEFGELLSTDIGKEHLKTLESVTRIGGGLGLHLLLVTQTFTQLPAQVAANTGLRMCFRVQTAADSKIVLESGAAATISHGRPGRGYARFHRGDLVEFQSARVAGRRMDLAADAPSVRVVPAPLGTLASFNLAPEREEVPVVQSDLGAILAGAASAAKQSGWHGSAIPWPDELPRVVPLASVLGVPEASAVPLGLADIPERQHQEVVSLGPADEQVLLVGGTRSGAGEALLTMVCAASVKHAPETYQFHAIDLSDGVLAPLVALPNVGTVAVRNESLALKIVRHLLETIAERRSLFASHGVTSIHELSARGIDVPVIVVALHGAERLIAKEENAATPLSPAVLRLLAESPGTGIHMWVTGSSVLGYHRLGTAMARRIVMPIPEIQEYPQLGVPRTVGVELDGPGRAYDVSSNRVLQFACLSEDSAVPAGDVVRALGQRLTAAHAARASDAGVGPKRIIDLSWPLLFQRLDARALVPPGGYIAPLAVALDTTTGEWAWLDAEDDGPVLVVGGGARSGRSSALLAIAQVARQVGWAVIGLPASKRSPLWRAEAPLDLVVGVDTARPAHLDPLSRPTVILVDDAHRLDMDDLGLKPVLESEYPAIIVAAGAVDFVSRRSGFLRTLPKVRTAVLLAPSNASDASSFGLSRIPDSALTDARSGRGLLVAGGEWQEIQFPFRREWTA